MVIEDIKDIPDAIADERSMLSMLLASCRRLQSDMGGTDATRNCTGLLTSWDNRNPTIFYLERNMRWALEVLERGAGRDY